MCVCVCPVRFGLVIKLFCSHLSFIIVSLFFTKSSSFSIVLEYLDLADLDLGVIVAWETRSNRPSTRRNLSFGDPSRCLTHIQFNFGRKTRLHGTDGSSHNLVLWFGLLKTIGSWNGGSGI